MTANVPQTDTSGAAKKDETLGSRRGDRRHAAAA